MSPFSKAYIFYDPRDLAPVVLSRFDQPGIFSLEVDSIIKRHLEALRNLPFNLKPDEPGKLNKEQRSYETKPSVQSRRQGLILWPGRGHY